nr:MAG TPA: hypothetical protein [Caudoviricetes sp.]
MIRTLTLSLQSVFLRTTSLQFGTLFRPTILKKDGRDVGRGNTA